jgi:protein translocase SecG subunit
MVIAIVLTVLILVQNRGGGGLSGVFGGSETSNVHRAKRGMEKTLFTATIIFSILFLGLSLANLFLSA